MCVHYVYTTYKCPMILLWEGHAGDLSTDARWAKFAVIAGAVHTRAYGRDVGVLKAGRRRCPRSCAIERSCPWYQGKWKGCPVWFANWCPDSSPPRTRIVVSNTWGLVFTSNETQSMMSRTALSKAWVSLRTTRVSSESIRVTEKFPDTSFLAMFALLEMSESYV